MILTPTLPKALFYFSLEGLDYKVVGRDYMCGSPTSRSHPNHKYEKAKSPFIQVGYLRQPYTELVSASLSQILRSDAKLTSSRVGREIDTKIMLQTIWSL